MDERTQIRRVLKGDTSAFGYFVDAYQDMAMTIAYRICGNRQDAEDIVQNAYVKTFHNLSSFRTDSKFSTWFYRIVYNTALSYINSSLYSSEYVDYKCMEGDTMFSDHDVFEQLHESEKKVLVNEVLDQMKNGERLLLTLYYLEENTVKDISLITGLSETNVKVKMHRARKAFMNIMNLHLRKEQIR